MSTNMVNTNTNMNYAKKELVSVIVPPVVCHNLDPHTGIPFMPHMAAYMAAALRAANYAVQVIDCFGLQPNNRQVIGEFMLMGIDEDWVSDHLDPTTRVAYIYCRTMAEFIAVERLVAKLKTTRSDIKICLFENVQAVTSYSLRHVVQDFMKIGCDAAILGEPETRANDVTECLIHNLPMDKIPGVAYLVDSKVKINPEAELERDIDSLLFPSWDLFPLEGYWIAGFAHAPKNAGKFVPMLTSRGCPYRCTFCIAPEVNPTWRGRSAVNVVDEMEHLYKTLGISDFHISDLDPTVKDKRTREICSEIISRKLQITWKLAQGTKIETIKSEETIELMAESGCKFISFSPESGSKKMLEIMNKPFDHEHALRMVRKMNELGIRSQACFIAGVPGELEEDRKESIEYVKRLVKAGVDEVAVFIFTPVPGSDLSKALDGFTHYSQCTPSPTWRKDYKTVLSYRRRMYLTYFLYKLLFPGKVAREIASIIRGKYETKMEMSLFKLVKLYLLRFSPWLFQRLDADKNLRKPG